MVRVMDANKRGWAGGPRRNLGTGLGSTGETDSTTDFRDAAMSLALPQSQCLPVARGLIALILHMDFTCNIDMFLLACKVLARIVWCSRPALPLNDLITSDQLLKLVRMAVWQDPHQSSWGGPWAAHAITCLLQDVLDGVRGTSASTSRETSPAEEMPDTRPGPSQQPGCSRTTTYDKIKASAGKFHRSSPQILHCIKMFSAM